ncbi:hypothetical protein Tco_0909574 [Tanacetum coccineum]|uniref:Uncharacterized protein n=1 Tax=Tanacetum coccineum TaxID=301880 RepID=A0ABQ5CRE3_9ASTR
MQADSSSLKKDAFDIENMMIEIFYTFKGQSTPSSSVPKTTLAITEGQATIGRGNLTHNATEENPSYTEAEKDDMVTKEAVEKEPTKEPEVENVEKEPESASRPIPITIVRTLTKPAPKLEMIRSPSRIQLTDTILEVLIPQSTGPLLDITPPEQPESPPAAPKADRGMCKVTDDVESPLKLVKASSKVRLDSDTIIRVVQEEATKARVDPKILASAKGGQEFRKIQDAQIKVHNREHSKKIKRSRELRKKRIEKYRWATSSRLKPETITDVKIHPNTKLVAMTFFRG